MRKAQGISINIIVLTALAILVLVVVVSFFITGYHSHFCDKDEETNCLTMCDREHMLYKSCLSNETSVNCTCSIPKNYIISKI